MRTSWKVRATPFLATRLAPIPVMVSPYNLISPEFGRSAPEIRFIIVVLPEPFGPMRPKTSFSPSSKVMSSTAMRPRKCLVRPLALKAAAVEALDIVALPPLQNVAHRSRRGIEDALQRTGSRSAELGAAVHRILDQPYNAVRNDIDDEQEAHAQKQRGLIGEIDGDQLPHQHEENGADQRAPEAVSAAEERHDHHLERHERAEGDDRLDVAPAR